MDPHQYNVTITWNADRRGTMCSPEIEEHAAHKPNCVEVATPPQFPSGIPGIWSPEHLYTAAVSSCLMTTFLAIAENSKLEFRSFTCGSSGTLDKVEGKFQMTAVELRPTLEILHEKDLERAQRILEKSEAACLISNSITAKVTMIPQIIVVQ